MGLDAGLRGVGEPRATYSPSSGQVTARNVGYNGGIPANGSVTIGFQATHTGNNARPSSFTLNGASCTVA